MDEIVIAEYDPRWPGLFDREAARIRAALGDERVTRIEHFGSTAVPGLAAKPIVDLLVGVRSLEAARNVAVPALEALGYGFWADNPDPERLFFVKGLPPHGPRSHHVHMIAPDSPVWEQLLFRDLLRRDPQQAQHYADLKRALAARFPTDREAYTQAKGDHIRAVMGAARRQSA